MGLQLIGPPGRSALLQCVHQYQKYLTGTNAHRANNHDIPNGWQVDIGPRSTQLKPTLKFSPEVQPDLVQHPIAKPAC